MSHYMWIFYAANFFSNNMFFTLQYNEANEKYGKTVARVVEVEFGFEICAREL